MIRMMIVDDEYYIRLGIANAIDWASMDVEIVGEAADGETGLALARKMQPDLILTDIRMPFLNGLKLMEELRKLLPDCGIIVLSGYDDFAYAQQSIRYGVLDYLLKPIDKQKLKETVARACLTLRNKRSLRHYQQFARQEHPSIRNQFLSDLLLGRLTEEDTIREKIEFLHLPLTEGSFQVICVRLDDYSLLENQLSLEDLQQLKDAIVGHLDACFLLGQTYLGMTASLAPDEWGIILAYTVECPSPEEDSPLHQNVRQLFEQLTAFTPHTVSLSISPVSDSIPELPKLYRDARQANKKFIPCKNSVVWPDVSPESELRPEVAGILNFVANHYNEPLTIQQVSESLYISPSYLMHLFKDSIGKTFNTFLMEYRMEKAKELLKQPGLQIQNVAAQVGYSDVKYFNKLFKKHTSLTPSDYIRIHYAK